MVPALAIQSVCLLLTVPYNFILMAGARNWVRGPVAFRDGEEGEHTTAFSETSFSSFPAQLSGPRWPELDTGGVQRSLKRAQLGSDRWSLEV